MTKLIEAFKAKPTPANRERLQTYIHRHPMAICLCPIEQIDFLRAHHFAF
jgi:hypothetical protein